MHRLAVPLAVILNLALAPGAMTSAWAQAPAAPLAPFEPKLMRLSEILGSLHYLRNLCGESTTAWRDEMEALLTAENPDAAGRARFIAAFNSGYRSFSGIYATCTESAHAAIARYMLEGETIARETAARFGN